MLYQREQTFDITADENDDIDALIGDSDRNNLLDDIQSRIGLEHPIVYDTYDLCAYHKEGKLQAFNVAMLKTILRHFEVPFRAKDRKTDLIRLLKAHVHPNGFARWCFCFETILLSNAVF